MNTEKLYNYWYWEYIITFWNEVDSKAEERAGVVLAETLSEAMQIISEYYGEESILDVKTFKPIIDGAVFDFQDVTDEKFCDFDFSISKKE